jgi:hypothetical protein
MTRQIPAASGSDGMVHDVLLTIAQAGEYLGTGERFVRRLVGQRRSSDLAKRPGAPSSWGSSTPRLSPPRTDLGAD